MKTCTLVPFIHSARLATLLLLLLSFAVHGFESMVLGVPSFKPYTFEQNGKIVGSAIIPVSQALNASGVKFELRIFNNYSDVLKALRKDKIQGFFLASHNLARDKYAVFSKAVTTNNWTWFTLTNSSYQVGSDRFKLNAVVGTVTKTNTFRWLSRNGYRVVSSGLEQLPSLLKNKKVDAVFAAQAVFEHRSHELGIAPTFFIKTIESKKPFGIYISRWYLQNNKGFMEVLNGSIRTR